MPCYVVTRAALCVGRHCKASMCVCCADWLLRVPAQAVPLTPFQVARSASGTRSAARTSVTSENVRTRSKAGGGGEGKRALFCFGLRGVAHVCHRFRATPLQRAHAARWLVSQGCCLRMLSMPRTEWMPCLTCLVGAPHMPLQAARAQNG